MFPFLANKRVTTTTASIILCNVTEYYDNIPRIYTNKSILVSVNVSTQLSKIA